jgi:hypothetical protein
MKLSRTLSAIAIISLNVLFALPVTAQTSFGVDSVLNLNPSRNTDRAKEVMQDNEFVVSAETVGTFFINPLLLDGNTLDYSTFSLQSKGELSLVKGGALTGNPIQIPFYVYLRRNGRIIQLHGEETLKLKRLKIDLSMIMKFALPGDQLIIEPVNKEDWQAKRILKLMEGGC